MGLASIPVPILTPCTGLCLWGGGIGGVVDAREYYFSDPKRDCKGPPYKIDSVEYLFPGGYEIEGIPSMLMNRFG